MLSGIIFPHVYSFSKASPWRIKLNEYDQKEIHQSRFVIIISGIIIAGGLIFYLFNMPHRNVQASATDSTDNEDDFQTHLY